MRFFILLIAVASLAAADVNPTCARDNCLRAVIASGARPGPSSASKDCSSFFLNTVTPATSTVLATTFTTQTAPPVTQTSTKTGFSTVYTTVTTVTVENSSPAVKIAAANAVRVDHRRTPVLAIRQQTIIPTIIPIYASACSGTARYSSACSCIGVSKTTTTVVAPLTTSTLTSTITTTPTVYTAITITSTTTVSATATATCSGFYLQAQNSTVNGQYVSLPGSDDEGITSFTAYMKTAALFTLGTNGLSGNLFNGQFSANTDRFSPATIYFDTQGQFSGVTDLVCNLPGKSSGGLSCRGYTSGATIFQLCPEGCFTGAEPCGGVAFGTTLDSRCQILEFTAIPVRP